MADYNLTSKSPNKNANQPTEVPRFENSEENTNNYKLANIDKQDVGAGSSAGTNKVLIDYANGRIIINDGTNDRVLIGWFGD